MGEVREKSRGGEGEGSCCPVPFGIAGVPQILFGILGCKGPDYLRLDQKPSEVGVTVRSVWPAGEAAWIQGCWPLSVSHPGLGVTSDRVTHLL